MTSLFKKYWVYVLEVLKDSLTLDFKLYKMMSVCENKNEMIKTFAERSSYVGGA